MKKSRKYKLMTAWNVFCIVVILGFFVFSMVIGGSAGLGYQENGRYFVANHGQIIEVTRTVWRISRIWEIAFFVFTPIMPLGAFCISKIEEE
ncbi:MAG: hypothetical protein E7612_07665 [Ruminococcaceae bacterium]|nr:hypothetical protein [Oscillospiraceae bacterium]